MEAKQLNFHGDTLYVIDSFLFQGNRATQKTGKHTVLLDEVPLLPVLEGGMLMPAPGHPSRPLVNECRLGGGGGGGNHLLCVYGSISLGCKVGLEEYEHSVPLMMWDFRGRINVLCVTQQLPRQGE